MENRHPSLTRGHSTDLKCAVSKAMEWRKVRVRGVQDAESTGPEPGPGPESGPGPGPKAKEEIDQV